MFQNTSATTSSTQSVLVFSRRNGIGRQQLGPISSSLGPSCVLGVSSTASVWIVFVDWFLELTWLLPGPPLPLDVLHVFFCSSKHLQDCKCVEVDVLPRPSCDIVVVIIMEDSEHRGDSLLVTHAGLLVNPP